MSTTNDERPPPLRTAPLLEVRRLDPRVRPAEIDRAILDLIDMERDHGNDRRARYLQA